MPDIRDLQVDILEGAHKYWYWLYDPKTRKHIGDDYTGPFDTLEQAKAAACPDWELEFVGETDDYDY